jgi:hypothetical protein
MQENTPTLQMKSYHVVDKESGLSAYTFLAPDGWAVTADVIWNRYNTFNPAHFYTSCYNNDGLTIQVLAGSSYRYWINPMGNSGEPYPPADITEALKRHFQWLRGNNVHFTEAEVLSSSQNAGMQGFNNNTMIYNQYGRVRGVYEQKGVRFDEILYGTMSLMHTKQPPDLIGFFMDDYTWELSDLFLSSASGNRRQHCLYRQVFRKTNHSLL